MGVNECMDMIVQENMTNNYFQKCILFSSVLWTVKFYYRAWYKNIKFRTLGPNEPRLKFGLKIDKNRTNLANHVWTFQLWNRWKTNLTKTPKNFIFLEFARMTVIRFFWDKNFVKWENEIRKKSQIGLGQL